jgi:hypothetical protein
VTAGIIPRNAGASDADDGASNTVPVQVETSFSDHAGVTGKAAFPQPVAG